MNGKEQPRARQVGKRPGTARPGPLLLRPLPFPRGQEAGPLGHGGNCL